MNVGQVQRVGELSLSAVARVRDQVDFRKTRLGHIPTVGFYRNVVLEQRPRFGLSVQALLALALLPRQPPVDLPRRPRIPRRFPNPYQQAHHTRTVSRLPSPWPRLLTLPRRWPV